VTTGAASLSATIGAGRWAVKNIELDPGLNLITARLATNANVKQVIAVVRGEGLSARPTRKVNIVWAPGVDEELRDLASQTLAVPLDEQALNQFAARVKQKVPMLLAAFYGNADIRIVDAPDESAHQVNFLPLTAGGLFGLSGPNCADALDAKYIQVHVGSFRLAMSSALNDAAPVDRWEPMSKADSVDVRVDDVAYALARGAAHELGHSVGLVAEPSEGACGWMNGCDGRHSCQSFDENNRTADHKLTVHRYGSGWFVMDPGDRILGSARIAERDIDIKDRTPSTRPKPRGPATFDDFSSSYLRLIHPR
jgi:hypothetical protein